MRSMQDNASGGRSNMGKDVGAEPGQAGTMDARHLSDVTLANLCDARLAAAEAAKAAEHIAVCARCRRELEWLQRLQAEVAAGTLPAPQPAAVRAVLTQVRARRIPEWNEVAVALERGESWALRLRDTLCAAMVIQLGSARAARRRNAMRAGETVEVQVCDENRSEAGRTITMQVRADSPLEVRAEGTLTAVLEAKEATFDGWGLKMVLSLPEAPPFALTTTVTGRTAHVAAEGLKVESPGRIPLRFARFFLLPTPERPGESPP